MAGGEIFLQFATMDEGAREAHQAAAELENNRADYNNKFAGLTGGTTGMGGAPAGAFTDLAATDGLAQTVQSINQETDVNGQHNINYGNALTRNVEQGAQTVAYARTILMNA